MIYDLWEAATGQRLINNNYFRIGGVACDLPWGWLEKCKDFCDWFGPKIDEYEKLITNNPIFRRRIEGLGVIGKEQAINWSLSGPMLRAAGVPWDLRKVDHYECYDDFEWDIAWEKEGDCYARYRVRIEEMRQSLKILRQACEMIPGGPTENLEAQRTVEGKKGDLSGFDYQYVAKKVAPTFKIPNGELYTRLESGKGEIGVRLVGSEMCIRDRACEMIPGGATENLEAKKTVEGKKGDMSGFDYQYVAKKVAPTFKIPNGELYTRLESGKGEIGVFLSLIHI